MASDDGIAAECVLAVLGCEIPDQPESAAVVYTGALLFVEALHELKQIRRALVHIAQRPVVI